HACAHEPLELFSEPGQARGATGDQDLRDRQRLRLRLVELQRRDELTRKRAELFLRRRSRRLEATVGLISIGFVLFERERLLELESLFARQAEIALEGGIDTRATPVEHTGEVADRTVGDRKDRPVVTDVDR